MDILFNLPDFYRGRGIYSRLFEMIKKEPKILLPNTKIAALFGNFPASIWNGGAVLAGGTTVQQDIQQTIGTLNYEYNMPLRFTFTNPLIEEKQYYDTYSNIIAELGHNGNNQILVCDPGLELYLRKNYPNYKYCRSILAAKDIPYELHGPYGDYFLSVIRRNKNNDWDYLNTISQEDRPYIEFLCNDPCPDDCPRLYTHYIDMANVQKYFKGYDDSCYCTMQKEKTIFEHRNMETKLHTYISREMIEKNYLPNNLDQFKLSGRESKVAIIYNILSYLISPEYYSDMFYYLLTAAYVQF